MKNWPTLTPLNEEILKSFGFEQIRNGMFVFVSKVSRNILEYNLATKAFFINDILHDTPVIFAEEMVMIVQGTCPEIIQVGKKEDNPYIREQ